MQPKMMTTVDIRAVFDSSLAVGSTSPRTVTIDRAKGSGEADAIPDDIWDLIHHADRVAETPNSLRFGTEVKLAQFKAFPLP
jgi:hypothetical protein